MRARISDWEATNDIIPEGAIALIFNDEGKVFMKIGDGVSPYQYLPFFGSHVFHEYSNRVFLSRCKESRAGEISNLTITLPDPLDEDYYSSLTFDTAAAPMIIYPEGITFTGDDCAGKAFFPAASTHYTLFFWYDGSMQCTVRGVKLG